MSALSRPHTARRRLAVAACSVFCLGVLSAESAVDQAPVRLPTSHAASPGWLTSFNAWRANTGTAMVSEYPTWSTGDYDHALYMVKNNLITHYETPGTPYYTVDGDTAARNSNIFVSSSTATTDEDAIDWWMGAPFHAMGMMDPRLTLTGFGSYREVKSGWNMGAAVDVLRGNSFSGGSFPIFFPGNGSIEPLTEYSGNEFPDPLQACSGYSLPTGLPVFVEVGGNVATTVSAHSFSANGVQLAHCVIDSNSPSVGSGLASRGGAILIPRQPLQYGVKYSVAMTVNGVAYAWSFTVGSFSSCTSMTASVTPVAQASAGTKVTVTGTASGCPNPLYQFWLLPPGGTWTVVRSYASSPSFTWDTTGGTPGSWRFSVWTRDASSGSSYDAFSAFPYTLTTAPCTSMTTSTLPAGAATAGNNVTVTGSASGCPNPLYEFWLLPPGGTWSMFQPYSINPTFTWSTAGKPAGSYRFSVWARDATSGNAYDAFSAFQYALTLSTCTGMTATTNPAGAATAGNSVTVIAAASGCITPLYAFYLLPPGGTWTLVQPYSTSPSFTWSTAGSPAGSYRFSVWARDSSSGSSYDAFSAFPYTLTAAPCTGVSVGTMPSVVASSGNNITVSASAAGCPNPLYQFWLYSPSGGWAVVQGYSSNANFVWVTTGKPAGSYRFSVWVKDASSSGTNGTAPYTYDAFAAFPYSLT